MFESPKNSKTEIQIYDGFGHDGNLVVYGHVLKRIANPKNRYTTNIWYNSLDMMKLFFVKPYSNSTVRLFMNQQMLETVAGKDGFFQFEWKVGKDLLPGRYELSVEAYSKSGEFLKSADGQIYIPEPTKLGIISDIDDTVMVSYSSRFSRRMREILIRHSQSRKVFPEVCQHYKLLSRAQTDEERLNPFFYISSSEWNLYGYLKEFFRFNDLPNGIFMLSQIKRWYQILKTGKSNHFGKSDRIVRILETFPHLKFVLLGDNSQADPLIYQHIAGLYPQRIAAIYIRNVRRSKEQTTLDLVADMASLGIPALLYRHSEEALAHSVRIGLLDQNVLEDRVLQ